MKKTKKFPKPRIDNDGYLRGVITADVSESIERDLEGWLDLLSIRLSGTELLMDIGYEIIGFDAPDTLYLEVWGDPSAAIESSTKLKKMWDAAEKKWGSKNKRRKRCGSAA